MILENHLISWVDLDSASIKFAILEDNIFTFILRHSIPLHVGFYCDKSIGSWYATSEYALIK